MLAELSQLRGVRFVDGLAISGPKDAAPRCGNLALCPTELPDSRPHAITVKETSMSHGMTVERLHYFNGRRLEAADLELEQRYHMDMRRLLNRELFTPGVVSGLEVAQALAEDGKPSKTKVRVADGLALDPLGRELVVAERDPRRSRPAADDGTRRLLPCRPLPARSGSLQTRTRAIRLDRHTPGSERNPS